MPDQRPENRPGSQPKASPPADDDYHCPNCLYLADPTRPGEGFWACQNLCIR